MPLGARPDRPTVGELLERLQALGSHKAIALHLAEYGITGTQCNAGTCPIALYLQQETGNFEIHVGEEDAAIWRSGAVSDQLFPLPAAVRDFIAFFDAGMYPKLIAA